MWPIVVALILVFALAAAGAFVLVKNKIGGQSRDAAAYISDPWVVSDAWTEGSHVAWELSGQTARAANQKYLVTEDQATGSTTIYDIQGSEPSQLWQLDDEQAARLGLIGEVVYIADDSRVKKAYDAATGEPVAIPDLAKDLVSTADRYASGLILTTSGWLLSLGEVGGEPSVVRMYDQKGNAVRTLNGHTVNFQSVIGMPTSNIISIGKGIIEYRFDMETLPIAEVHGIGDRRTFQYKLLDVSSGELTPIDGSPAVIEDKHYVINLRDGMVLVEIGEHGRFQRYMIDSKGNADLIEDLEDVQHCADPSKYSFSPDGELMTIADWLYTFATGPAPEGSVTEENSKLGDDAGCVLRSISSSGKIAELANNPDYGLHYDIEGGGPSMTLDSYYDWSELDISNLETGESILQPWSHYFTTLVRPDLVVASAIPSNNVQGIMPG